jgi:uncharacterized membrane protein
MKTVQSIAKSEIEISYKNGIKADGLISWAVLGAFVFLGFIFIKAKYGAKIKEKVKTHRAKRKAKKATKRRRK